MKSRRTSWVVRTISSASNARRTARLKTRHRRSRGIPIRRWSCSFRKDNSFKSQIVRETPLTDAAKNMNAIFHSMLPANSVWQNYMLLSTQWPSAFAIHCTALRSQERAGSQDRFRQATRHDLLAGTDILREFDAGDIQPGRQDGRQEADRMADLRDSPAVPLATSSCIACHSNAVGFQRTASNREGGRPNLNQSDFTFMLEKAQ